MDGLSAAARLIVSEAALKARPLRPAAEPIPLHPKPAEPRGEGLTALLTARIATLSVPVSRLSDLKPGDTLLLGLPADEPIQLLSGGRMGHVAAEGELGAPPGRMELPIRLNQGRVQGCEFQFVEIIQRATGIDRFARGVRGAADNGADHLACTIIDTNGTAGADLQILGRHRRASPDGATEGDCGNCRETTPTSGDITNEHHGIIPGWKGVCRHPIGNFAECNPPARSCPCNRQAPARDSNRLAVTPPVIRSPSSDSGRRIVVVVISKPFTDTHRVRVQMGARRSIIRGKISALTKP